jgi:branched-subunit amino acid aminotransferase/4-amino-4-deoxychorismate lyase
MDRPVYYNGQITDASEVRIEAASAGVLYGWGVFTNVRVYDGAAFSLDRHWERLSRHAERARVAVTCDYAEIERAVAELIRATPVRDGRARITLLKGSAGAWRTETRTESDLLILITGDVQRATTDLAITISPIRILSSSPLAGVKRTAMLDNLIALEEARGRSFSEAVMLNERGEIVSATASNIFWVEGDELFTPSLRTGCVAGVTRALVCEIVQGMRIHLVEGGFTIQRLLDASEIFLTSTAREIAPVTVFDIKQYDPEKRRLTRLVSREFHRIIRGSRPGGRGQRKG